jgi:hypothetical protein
MRIDFRFKISNLPPVENTLPNRASDRKEINQLRNVKHNDLAVSCAELKGFALLQAHQ